MVSVVFEDSGELVGFDFVSREQAARDFKGVLRMLRESVGERFTHGTVMSAKEELASSFVDVSGEQFGRLEPAEPNACVSLWMVWISAFRFLTLDFSFDDSLLHLVFDVGDDDSPTIPCCRRARAGSWYEYSSHTQRPKLQQNSGLWFSHCLCQALLGAA